MQPITGLWVSPVKRTLQTMAPLAAKTGLSPRVHTRCFEAGGIYDADPTYTSFEPRGGLSRAAMSEMFPTYEIPPTVTEDGWYQGGGRESDDACRARAAEVVAEFKEYAAALAANEQVVLVVHYDFICAFLDALVVPAAGAIGEFTNWKNFNTGGLLRLPASLPH